MPDTPLPRSRPASRCYARPRPRKYQTLFLTGTGQIHPRGDPTSLSASRESSLSFQNWRDFSSLFKQDPHQTAVAVCEPRSPGRGIAKPTPAASLDVRLMRTRTGVYAPRASGSSCLLAWVSASVSLPIAFSYLLEYTCTVVSSHPPRPTPKSHFSGRVQAPR